MGAVAGEMGMRRHKTSTKKNRRHVTSYEDHVGCGESRTNLPPEQNVRGHGDFTNHESHPRSLRLVCGASRRGWFLVTDEKNGSHGISVAAIYLKAWTYHDGGR